MLLCFSIINYEPNAMNAIKECLTNVFSQCPFSFKLFPTKTQYPHEIFLLNQFIIFLENKLKKTHPKNYYDLIVLLFEFVPQIIDYKSSDNIYWSLFQQHFLNDYLLYITKINANQKGLPNEFKSKKIRNLLYEINILKVD